MNSFFYSLNSLFEKMNLLVNFYIELSKIINLESILMGFLKSPRKWLVPIVTTMRQKVVMSPNHICHQKIERND